MVITLEILDVAQTAVLRRGRAAAYALFLISGAVIGTWTARIPAIKSRLSLNDGDLSLGLLSLAAGGLIGMIVVGRLVDRYGSKAVMVPMALLVGPTLVLPAFAPNLLSLTVILGVLGAVHGTLNVAMNAYAVHVERAYQRPIMSAFHALFSIGGFLGAATGGLLAAAAIDAATTFIAVGVASFVLAVCASRWALADSSTPEVARIGPSSDHGHPSSAAVRPKSSTFVLLGLVAFCTLVGEGAAADWSSVYLHDGLHSSASLAATAYAAFALMMTLGRLTGDRLVATFGPATVVRGCGIVAAAGFAGGVLLNQPIAAIAGFACLGAGLSCIVPQVYSAAGNMDVGKTGKGLAKVAALGYLGFLTGPAIIGGAAHTVGLSHAMYILPILSTFVAATAFTVRRRPISSNEPKSVGEE